MRRNLLYVLTLITPATPLLQKAAGYVNNVASKLDVTDAL